MQRLLLAGCGKLATQLGLRRAAAGDRVFGLRRQASLLPEPIEPLSADLADPASLRASLPADLDAVVFTATPGTFTDAAYEQAYVRGFGNLLQSLENAGQSPARVIFVSSTSVYGDTGGAWVDETSATQPQAFSGRRLLQAESLLRPLGDRGVILRLGGIYGLGRERLLKRVREGRPVVADPPTYTNRIHQSDCIAVLDHLLTLPQAAPIYLGVDDRPSPMHEVLDWLADEMGLPRLPRQCGAPGDQRGSNKRCCNRRLRGSGFSFRYPDFRAGYRAMLDQGHAGPNL
ncbi:SDR family oxidoreductase [Methylonatrum kenyense]|uniref:SDR family oxidoreductase n=1 Tax=Methylonatrum kenyense TaxID=455253 RepID=UPI0020C03C75|nr:SDR family oxidoreductase [Methylonatrum kenyense]